VNRIIIAVGGSGQMVLHYYIQLFLLGHIREGFDAFVLDSANPLQSLKFLSDLFDDVRRALGPAADSEGVPKIKIIPLEQGAPGMTVAEMLTLAPLPPQPGFHHPAQVYFSRETLLQDVRQGLFARPALSAVMALRPALEAIDPLRLPTDAKVVLVCSCIGGTGGGLAVPLLWHLTNTPGAQPQVRAVLLGEYFTPRRGDTVGQDVPRFRSNRIGFLKALEQSVGALQLFSFIEEPKMSERDPEKEERADHLPWPKADQPYWRATASLEFLFREAVAAVAAKFSDRCVDPDNYLRILDPGASSERLKKSLGCVTEFLRRRVLAQMDREAPVRRIWGDGLVEVLVRYRELLWKAGVELAPGEFLRQVDREVGGVWSGEAGAYSLSRVFPECTPSPARVEQIRRTAWIRPPDGMSTEPFRDRKGALRRIASVLLYCALRKVGE
jgi:hypothetical protein